MAFLLTAITTLKTLVCAIVELDLLTLGVINLLEGYGTDNPAKSENKQIDGGRWHRTDLE